MYALKDNKNGYSMFYCDKSSDINDLPKANTANSKGEKCSPFSEAFVIEDGSAWVLRGDTDTWTSI